eukprot:Hpha_TRINITY_DN8061_c0_g1::TRINITY_DN8061_c0_g1_i1::g.140151::m.140151
MVSKTMKRKKIKAQREKEKEAGIEPKRFTEPTRGHMVLGKRVKMRHDLKKKRKYRIGTANSTDIYEGFEKTLPGMTKCERTKAALAAAAVLKASKTGGGVCLGSASPTAEPAAVGDTQMKKKKKKKVVGRLGKK